METKVQLKNLYLIAVIAIGLIGLGVGSTFAMFTANVSIDNPIAFNSNLSSTNSLAETIEVTVPAIGAKSVDLVISNSNAEALNYVAWYLPSTSGVSAIADSSDNNYNSEGALASSGSFTLTVTVWNRGSSTTTVTVGISSSSESQFVIPDGAVVVPTGTATPIINENAATYITNLYLDNKDATPVTNNGTDYYVASDEHLMNDRNGGVDTLESGTGNIRYYGASATTNNYMYFNCENYLAQDDETCELWRIIGIFDGKLKIIRNESIGTFSWDSSPSDVNGGGGISQWGPSTYISDGSVYSGADLMKILNDGFTDNQDYDSSGNLIPIDNSLYWRRESGVCHAKSNNRIKNCDFTSTGLRENTRSKISTETFSLSASSLNTPANAYAYERRTSYSVTATDDVNRNLVWSGKVGLMYISDYAYAVDFSKCNVNKISLYNSDSDPNYCFSNDWLITGSYEWFISHSSAQKACRTSTNGSIGCPDAANDLGVRPVVFLNSNTSFWVGNGTIDAPYQISN